MENLYGILLWSAIALALGVTGGFYISERMKRNG